MSIKGYKGSLIEIARDEIGFKDKCSSINLYFKLNDLEKIEENFNAINLDCFKYYYDKQNDCLYKVDVESFQPTYCLISNEFKKKIEFTSIFDDIGTSLEEEIKKIIKKKHD